MLILGLTGSIGMGKTATARAFAEAGVPVHEADVVVHRLYEGEAVSAIERAFPGTIVNGTVDRARLSKVVIGDPAAFARLEAIVHPLVRASTERFLAEAAARAARVVILDIPLLLETGGEKRVDAVVLVSAPRDVQRVRVLARADMTSEKLDAILAKQMPDSEKRRRAHFIVDTSRSLDSAKVQVRGILRAVAAIPGRQSLPGTGRKPLMHAG
jgi:dephospho-CoA kinase